MNTGYAFNEDSALKALAYQLASLQRCGVDIIAECFDFYRGGPAHDFDIYHIKAKMLPKGLVPGTVELAVLRKMPKAHSHHLPGTAWFFFLDTNCALDLGGASDETTSVLTRHKMQSGIFYPIPPYVFHAAGPWDDSHETRLLIFNPAGTRPRPAGSTYATDTYVTPHTFYWNEVSQGYPALPQDMPPTYVPPPAWRGYAGHVAAFVLILAMLCVPFSSLFWSNRTQTVSDADVAHLQFLRSCDAWLAQQARATGDERFLRTIGTDESWQAVYGTEF